MDYITKTKKLCEEVQEEAQDMFENFVYSIFADNPTVPIEQVRLACRMAWVNVRFS